MSLILIEELQYQHIPKENRKTKTFNYLFLPFMANTFIAKKKGFDYFKQFINLPDTNAYLLMENANHPVGNYYYLKLRKTIYSTYFLEAYAKTSPFFEKAFMLDEDMMVLKFKNPIKSHVDKFLEGNYSNMYVKGEMNDQGLYPNWLLSQDYVVSLYETSPGYYNPAHGVLTKNLAWLKYMGIDRDFSKTEINEILSKEFDEKPDLAKETYISNGDN